MEGVTHNLSRHFWLQEPIAEFFGRQLEFQDSLENLTILKFASQVSLVNEDTISQVSFVEFISVPRPSALQV
jgi:hypothetical protein